MCSTREETAQAAAEKFGVPNWFTDHREMLSMEGLDAVAVVPPRPPAELCRRVAIAWNGTVEAGRAIAAALSLLAGAARILVLSVGEEGKPGSAARDVVEYLAWHGIEAAAETLEASPRSVAGVLLEAASAASTDLLVMGAYTRSRLHRLIFGGVTREVLEGAEIPVLMAH